MSFQAPQFTTAGKRLQARALAGEVEITFTRMALGSGDLSSQAIADLKGLIEPVKFIDINNKKIINSDQVQLKAVFQNIGMTEGFFWREVGLFAADPDNPDDREKDILYCYQNAGDLAEYIPSASSQLVDKILSMSVVVADASAVHIAFFSESYALKEDLDEQIALQAQSLENHKTDANAHDELFSQYVKKTGDTMSGRLTFSFYDAIYRNVDTSYLHLCGGNVFGKSASLILNGGQNLDGSSSYGGFELTATNGEDMTNLVGQSTGALSWGGKNLVRSVNGVNADISGNVTITTDKFMPDYTSAVTYNITLTEQTLTIPYDCLLVFDSAGFNGTYCSLIIDDVLLIKRTTNGNSYIMSCNYSGYVKKGSIVKYKSGYGSSSSSFASTNTLTVFKLS